MDEAEDDVLACVSFPVDHWPKIHSTNGLERFNGEIKRRTVKGALPAVSQGRSAIAIADLQRLDEELAACAIEPAALRARSRILVISEVLGQHTEYFDSKGLQ